MNQLNKVKDTTISASITIRIFWTLNGGCKEICFVWRRDKPQFNPCSSEVRQLCFAQALEDLFARLVDVGIDAPDSISFRFGESTYCKDGGFTTLLTF